MFGFGKQRELARQEAERQKELEFRQKEEARLKKIQEIAEYMYSKNITIESILEANAFLKDYKENISMFNKKINESKNNNSCYDSSFIGLVIGIAGYVAGNAKEAFAKSEMEEYKKNNAEQLLKYENLLKLLPEYTSTYSECYTNEIITEIDKLKRMKEERTKHEEQMRITREEEQQRLENERQQQARLQAIENFEKEKKLKKETFDKQNKIDEVTRSINELEQFVPVLQNHVSNNKKIDFNLLASLEKYLDTIEDLKDFIPEDCVNNIERCQKKLNPLFGKCTNKDDIQVDADIIQESFNKILNKGE